MVEPCKHVVQHRHLVQYQPWLAFWKNERVNMLIPGNLWLEDSKRMNTLDIVYALNILLHLAIVNVLLYQTI